MPSLRNTGSAIASTIAAAKPLASGKCRVYFSCFFFSLLASKKSSDPLYFLGVFFSSFGEIGVAFDKTSTFPK